MNYFFPGRLLNVLILFLALGTALPSPIYGNHEKPGMHYSIEITSDEYKKANVDFSFFVQDSLLHMSGIGANQIPERWAAFVHDIKAVSADGKHLKIEDMEGAQWKIHAAKGTQVKLSYTIHLDHESHSWSGGVDGAAYARDWGVFYTGRSLFIMNGEKNVNLKATFKIPETWKISTPWEQIETKGHSYSIATQTDLEDSMIFAGTHEEKIIKRDQFELIFVLGGSEITAQKEYFGQMATGILDYYIELMGGIPNPAPDNAFNKSIVIINSYSGTDGEVIGNNISILLEEGGDQMSQMVGMFIFAHEFFHLWNGKSFTPVNNDCEWFKEGFSNYYTLKSLFHVGYLNRESYLQVLNNLFYQKYDQDDGLGRLSMTDGDQKHDHWGLIYSGGLFAAIAQDMIIRTATKNEKSLDDLMRGLYQKYGGTDQGYTLEELQSSLSQMSGKDQSAFFESYIKGLQRIPLEDFLNMGGFMATEENGNINISLKEESELNNPEITDGLFGIN
jgi:predicted metalloprotease with PDZ domain